MVMRSRVDGLQELGRAISALNGEVAVRLASRATGAGSRVIKKEAQTNIERSPSVVTRSLHGAVITKKVPKSEAEHHSEHIVTVRGRGKPYNKKGQKVDRAPHAHLVEFGTVNMPAEPFLRPAFEAKKEQAVTEMATVLRDGIERATKAAK